jgi:hypothetical protein
MAPYWEQVDQVELYEVGAARFLRVPYTVLVYDVPPYRYLAEEWIALEVLESGDYSVSRCPPTFTYRYQGEKPNRLAGTIRLDSSVAHIALVSAFVQPSMYKGEPYRFNGDWKLAQPNGPIPGPSSKGSQDSCKPRESASGRELTE